MCYYYYYFIFRKWGAKDTYYTIHIKICVRTCSNRVYRLLSLSYWLGPFGSYESKWMCVCLPCVCVCVCECETMRGERKRRDARVLHKMSVYVDIFHTESYLNDTEAWNIRNGIEYPARTTNNTFSTHIFNALFFLFGFCNSTPSIDENIVYVRTI